MADVTTTIKPHEREAAIRSALSMLVKTIDRTVQSSDDLLAAAGTGSCEFHVLQKRMQDIKAKLTEADRERLEADGERSLRQASIQLLVKQPFFGLLLCNMDRVPAWTLPTSTMAVDGEHLFWDPVFVSLCTRGELRADLCHEVLHLAFLHLTRRKGRDPELWNQAVDYVDNLVVKDECELPIQSWACYDQRFKGMTAEQVFRIIEKEREQRGGGSGKGQGQQPGGGCPDCQAEQNGNGNSNGTGNGQHVLDGHNPSPTITEDEIIDKVVRAAEAAKSTGSVPASVDTFLKRLRKHKVDWRKFIRGRALDIFNKKDYRYEIRSVITGAVAKSIGVRATWLPSLGSEEAKTLVCVIDTSGSVSKGLLKAFAAEVKGCMELADRTIIITSDAEPHEIVEVSKFDDIVEALKFRGGGGTDFRPAFRAVKKMGIDPELFIYFTDAYGPFPSKRPDFPVIWALTKNHGQTPPWGEAVVVTDDKDEADHGE
jgi:predicted metal-dependent peptidase